MRWDDVAKAVAAAAATDPTLVAIYGDAVRMGAAAQDHMVPSLEYMIVTDSGSELWEPVVIQWDQWTRDLPDLIASERALRKLFEQDSPVTIGGVYMWAMFTDGADLNSPDRAGYFGRAVRFRFTPIREDLRAGRS